MKKVMAPSLILLLVVVAVPVHGRSIPTRTVEEEYTAAGYYNAGGLYAQSYCMSINDNNTGGACFELRRDERTVSVEVTDESGMPVRGRIVVRGRPDVFFCGSTKAPVRLPAKQREVSVPLGIEGCGSQPAPPTRGVISATFD